MRYEGENKLKFHQIVGVAGGEIWSQVRVVGAMAEEERRNRGELVIVASLRGGEDLMSKGGELVEEIAKRFNEGEDTKSWLEGEVGKLKGELNEQSGVLLANFKLIEGGVEVWIGGVGEVMRMEIKREGSRAVIWEGGGLVKGEVRRGDVVVAGTRELVDGEWEWKEDIDLGVEETRGKILIAGDSAVMAGVVVEVVKEEKREEEDGDEEIKGGVIEKEKVEEPEDEEKGEKEDGEEVDEMEKEDGGKEEGDKEEEEDGGVKMARTEGGGEEEGGEKDGREFVAVEEAEEVREEVIPMRRRRGLIGNWKLMAMDKRRWGLIVGVVFVLLLGVSVAVGLWQKQVRAEEKEFMSISEPIVQTIEEAVSVSSLSSARARKLAMEAREEVKKQGDRFDKGRNKGKWEKLKADVEEVWKRVSGEKTVEGERWLDVGVVREETKIGRLAVLDGVVAVLDTEAGVLLSVDLDDKSGEVLAGGSDLRGARDVGGSENKAVVITEEGVVEVDLKSGTARKVIEKEGDSWGKRVGWFAGNVYLLDDQELWKYPVVGDGYGKRRRYLGVGVVVDMNGVVDMPIDGRIFLGYENGGVKKFERGEVVSLDLESLDGGWGKIAGMMVESEGNRLFIWDKENSRVVALDKEKGGFLAEYKWEGFKDGEAMAVDEERKRLLVGRGGEIWTVGVD